MRVDEAGDHVDAEQDAVGPDSGEPRRLAVVAGGIHVLAPGGQPQRIEEAREQQSMTIVPNVTRNPPT